MSEIKQHEARSKNRCRVKAILEMLEKDDRHDLEVAMADPSISAGAIARALCARGVDLNPNGERIRLHRRGLCGCARQ